MVPSSDLVHLHLLLNHFPTVGMIVGFGVFLLALVNRSVDLKRGALAGTDIAELQKTNPVSRTRACSRSWAASSRSWTARRRVAFRSAHAADRRSWLAARDQGDVLCASATCSGD